MRKTIMSSSLSTTVTGLYQTVSRATQSADNIANASLTGKNVDGDLVNLKTDSATYAAEADVVKTEEKMQKSLLDIKV
jgi:flagellar hook protein FlgE